MRAMTSSEWNKLMEDPKYKDPSHSHNSRVKAIQSDFGGGDSGHILGMIGNGEKTHYLYAEWAMINGDQVVISASSHCGSQRWTSGGFSRLHILTDATPDEVATCRKCNGGQNVEAAPGRSKKERQAEKEVEWAERNRKANLEGLKSRLSGARHTLKMMEDAKPNSPGWTAEELAEDTAAQKTTVAELEAKLAAY